MANDLCYQLSLSEIFFLKNWKLTYLKDDNFNPTCRTCIWCKIYNEKIILKFICARYTPYYEYDLRYTPETTKI